VPEEEMLTSHLWSQGLTPNLDPIKGVKPPKVAFHFYGYVYQYIENKDLIYILDQGTLQSDRAESPFPRRR
jgi:hypothetical protein